MSNAQNATNGNSKRKGSALRPTHSASRARERRMAAIVEWQRVRDEKLRAWHDGGPAPWER